MNIQPRWIALAFIGTGSVMGLLEMTKVVGHDGSDSYGTFLGAFLLVGFGCQILLAGVRGGGWRR
jgi:hypothetical protein